MVRFLLNTSFQGGLSSSTRNNIPAIRSVNLASYGVITFGGSSIRNRHFNFGTRCSWAALYNYPKSIIAIMVGTFRFASVKYG